MSIKYHQYGLGNEYGADHMLTDNWNPDMDYGNEYVNGKYRKPSAEWFSPNEERVSRSSLVWYDVTINQTTRRKQNE